MLIFNIFKMNVNLSLVFAFFLFVCGVHSQCCGTLGAPISGCMSCPDSGHPGTGVGRRDSEICKIHNAAGVCIDPVYNAHNPSLYSIGGSEPPELSERAIDECRHFSMDGICDDLDYIRNHP